nr:unnamed protein product [Callosobruchus analis]
MKKISMYLKQNYKMLPFLVELALNLLTLGEIVIMNL